MQFDINTISRHKEFIISIDSREIINVLLHKQEAKTLGKDLFEAAYELMDEEDFKELIRWKYKEQGLFEKDEDY